MSSSPAKSSASLKLEPVPIDESTRLNKPAEEAAPKKGQSKETISSTISSTAPTGNPEEGGETKQLAMDPKEVGGIEQTEQGTPVGGKKTQLEPFRAVEKTTPEVKSEGRGRGRLKESARRGREERTQTSASEGGVAGVATKGGQVVYVVKRNSDITVSDRVDNLIDDLIEGAEEGALTTGNGRSRTHTPLSHKLTISSSNQISTTTQSNRGHDQAQTRADSGAGSHLGGYLRGRYLQQDSSSYVLNASKGPVKSEV